LHWLKKLTLIFESIVERKGKQPGVTL